MIAKTPSSLVPNLRLPEFRDEPGWPRRLMGRYLSESRIKGSTGAQAKKLTVKLWGKGVAEKQEALLGSANTQYYSRRAGQFIYSKLDFLNQAFGIIPAHLDGFESTLDLPCFDIDSDLNAKFLLEYVQRGQFYMIRGEIADGGRKAKRVQVETFLECPIFAPSMAEQQKIADCLDSLDNLIAAEGRKLEAMRQHKQGLMQQLFPRPGETRPRLRFPEFRNSGHWAKELLSKLCDIKHGYAFEGEFFSDGGKYVVLTPGNFYERGGYRDRGEKQKYYAGEIPRDYVLDRGDLLVAMTEQAAGLLGSSILVVDSDKFLHNQRLGLVTKKDGVAWSNDFFFYVFNTQPVRAAIHCSASGMKVRHTSPAKIGQVVVSFPASLAEQERVAACLSALVSRIAAQTDKLDALKEHKQGLVQQLFPSLEDALG